MVAYYLEFYEEGEVEHIIAISKHYSLLVVQFSVLYTGNGLRMCGNCPTADHTSTIRVGGTNDMLNFILHIIQTACNNGMI